MNWNLRTFRLYNNDLWGTLLTSSTLTRPLKQLLRVRKKTRYFYKSTYGGFSKKLLKKKAKFKFFKKFYNTFNRKKGFYSIKSHYLPTDKLVKRSRVLKLSFFASLKRRLRLTKLRNRLKIISSTLWKRLNYLLRGRYQFGGYRKKKLNKPTKKKSRFIIDYTKRRSYNKFKVRIKRRAFNSQRLIDFRKFKKFYSNLNAVQFYRAAAKSKFIESNILNNFISKLESRLDMVLFRSGLVTSLFMAKHLISHGHILINDNISKQMGYTLSKYDLVSFSLKKLVNVRNLIKVLYKNKLKQYVRSGAPKRFKSKVASIFLFKPMYLEVDYCVLSTVLVADICVNKVFYPFKVSFHELELFLSRVRKKI
jgi:ribosomal protein S4